MLCSTSAIVLNYTKFGDTSLICNLYSKDYGKFSIIAKGARSLKNPHGAILEPLNYIDLIYYFKQILSDAGGFIKCGWDGNSKTENLIKKDTKATIRCILKEIDDPAVKCIYSQSKAKYEVVFSKAY